MISFHFKSTHKNNSLETINAFIRNYRKTIARFLFLPNFQFTQNFRVLHNICSFSNFPPLKYTRRNNSKDKLLGAKITNREQVKTVRWRTGAKRSDCVYQFRYPLGKLERQLGYYLWCSCTRESRSYVYPSARVSTCPARIASVNTRKGGASCSLDNFWGRFQDWK